jgi:hypothetical protein
MKILYIYKQICPHITNALGFWFKMSCLALLVVLVISLLLFVVLVNPPTHKLPTILSHILIINCLKSIYSKKSLPQWYDGISHHWLLPFLFPNPYKIFASYFLPITAIRHLLLLLCCLVYSTLSKLVAWLVDTNKSIFWIPAHTLSSVKSTWTLTNTTSIPYYKRQVTF